MLLAAVALGAASVAGARSAKDFGPGDVRVCGPHRCLALGSQPVLDRLASFYYGPHAPAAAAAPPRRAPYLRLVYRDGYVTGVVAGRRFDRFLSFGVNLGQFAARRWYAVPAPVAAELCRLAPRLAPQPLPRGILAGSR